MRGRLGIMLLAVVSVAVLAGCGDDELVAPSPASRGTVAGVGVLPEALSRPAGDVVATTTTVTTSSTIPRPTVTVERALPSVGARVEGNRLIMIGDSILASTSRRYTGEMCLGLVPLHWAVEVDAEKSRFIDFGSRVLDARLAPETGLDWDAAAVFLGTNYGGDIADYTRQLDEVLERLAPRPTLLYTVTEFKPNRVEVNAAIRNMLAYYPNVQVIDWAKITDDDPTLLSADGYHPSAAGISRLVYETAIVLGGAPTGGGGECLSSRFTDDSAGTGSGQRAPATTAPQGNRPRATTTTAGSARTTVPSGVATSTSVAATPAPTTTPVPNTPPTTTPAPTTAPPVTAVPTTTPPVVTTTVALAQAPAPAP